MRSARRRALVLIAAGLLACCDGEPREPAPTPRSAPEAPGAPSAGGLPLAVLEPNPQDALAHGREARAGHRYAHDDPGALPPPDPELGATPLSFFDLAAPRYEPPAPMAEGERPPLAAVLGPRVLAADGARVAVDGFATVEAGTPGAATRVLLTAQAPGCCLFGVPRADERVHARVPAELALDPDPFSPLRLVGRLRIEERTDALGLFEGLYFLEVEQVLAPWARGANGVAPDAQRAPEPGPGSRPPAGS